VDQTKTIAGKEYQVNCLKYTIKDDKYARRKKIFMVHRAKCKKNMYIQPIRQSTLVQNQAAAHLA
jgi:hypothetical protein